MPIGNRHRRGVGVALRKTLRDLSADELEVLHAMKALDRRGVYPAGGRVVDELPGRYAPVVRRVRLALLGWGLCKPVTPDDGLDNDDGAQEGEGPETAREGVVGVSAFNAAIVGVVDGKGSVLTHLSVLTGLTPNALKCRASRWRWRDEPADGPAPLDDNELREVRNQYGGLKNPAVREFLQGLNTMRRSHPDWRGRKGAG